MKTVTNNIAARFTRALSTFARDESGVVSIETAVMLAAASASIYAMSHFYDDVSVVLTSAGDQLRMVSENLDTTGAFGNR